MPDFVAVGNEESCLWQHRHLKDKVLSRKLRRSFSDLIVVVTQYKHIFCSWYTVIHSSSFLSWQIFKVMAESILGVKSNMVRLFAEEDRLLCRYIYSAIHLMYNIPVSSCFLDHSVDHCINIVKWLRIWILFKQKFPYCLEDHFLLQSPSTIFSFFLMSVE